jgi:citrate/tricarballylate utilization protein
MGGIGLLIGPVGLLVLKQGRNRDITDEEQGGMDVAFLVLLILTSSSGLLLLALRETAAMGTLLVVHLGIVLGLFLTIPYGKFVHGIYRFVALAKFALERKRKHVLGA